jgi:hypothetical protein
MALAFTVDAQESVVFLCVKYDRSRHKAVQGQGVSSTSMLS